LVGIDAPAPQGVEAVRWDQAKAAFIGAALPCNRSSLRGQPVR
jgi:hypothetical protein